MIFLFFFFYDNKYVCMYERIKIIDERKKKKKEEDISVKV
jgi:hypothetical protein